MALSFDSSLVDALGRASAEKLAAELDLLSVADLLTHYPRKYLQTGDASSESTLTEGDHLTFFAEVVSCSWIPNKSGRRGKGRCVATLRLQQGTIDAVFWNQQWIAKRLTQGTRALFTGIVGTFKGRWQLTQPSAEVLVDGSESLDGPRHKGLTFTSIADFADRLMPIYPATAKLDSGSIRRCVELTLDLLPPLVDPLPADELDRLGMVDLDTAFRTKHRPKDRGQVQAADRRLKLQEALTMQLALSVDRYENTLLPAIARPQTDGGLLAELDSSLPYELTEGQRQAGEIIAAEIAREHPMHRLLQGDVGSGKTLVALRAMLQVAASGGQSALLAPTEVLAHQHARSIGALLEPFGEPGTLGAHPEAVKVVVISSGMPAAKRKQAMLDTASGAASIVIGTHALLESKVSFADLGLVVIDEQHRFGVEQRDMLRRKGRDGTAPHTLVMTATPIPRTIAMTAFGDLETIVMSDLPPGRSPISTTAIPAGEKPAWLDRAWERIREEVAAGHQAYVVCPRIGLDDTAADDETGEEPGPEDDGAKQRVKASVIEVERRLSEGPLAGLRLAVLHGRLTSEEKDAVMGSFGAGQIDVLVSTTVIEVGVDVPNATTMVVLDADLFGLATLHQLRGRVGRGSAKGLCLLVTPMPSSTKPFERLRVLEETSNGFEIADRDLELRREGDILGVAQSGTRSQLRLLSLRDDADLLILARELCDRIIAEDPRLEQHPMLRSLLSSLDQQRTLDYLLKG
ncbi:ATP-dependent DNA helicase RecG [Blastococcus sp. Marseille-P5729]|uniref:ATP-dependent DNA helicase RecG n=1 Tax=Blastococcus sp. Marseille-P5729 TaxID=2086582 RepID=UPI0018FE9ADB|nr:ATP-dependent DNA helicase RecG [Blastococcus sp. Marseille-P5729]